MSDKRSRKIGTSRRGPRGLQKNTRKDDEQHLQTSDSEVAQNECQANEYRPSEGGPVLSPGMVLDVSSKGLDKPDIPERSKKIGSSRKNAGKAERKPEAHQEEKTTELLEEQVIASAMEAEHFPSDLFLHSTSVGNQEGDKLVGTLHEGSAKFESDSEAVKGDNLSHKGSNPLRTEETDVPIEVSNDPQLLCKTRNSPSDTDTKRHEDFDGCESAPLSSAPSERQDFNVLFENAGSNYSDEKCQANTKNLMDTFQDSKSPEIRTQSLEQSRKEETILPSKQDTQLEQLDEGSFSSTNQSGSVLVKAGSEVAQSNISHVEPTTLKLPLSVTDFSSEVFSLETKTTIMRSNMTQREEVGGESHIERNANVSFANDVFPSLTRQVSNDSIFSGNTAPPNTNSANSNELDSKASPVDSPETKKGEHFEDRREQHVDSLVTREIQEHKTGCETDCLCEKTDHSLTQLMVIRETQHVLCGENLNSSSNLSPSQNDPEQVQEKENVIEGNEKASAGVDHLASKSMESPQVMFSKRNAEAEEMPVGGDRDTDFDIQTQGENVPSVIEIEEHPYLHDFFLDREQRIIGEAGLGKEIITKNETGDAITLNQDSSLELLTQIPETRHESEENKEEILKEPNLKCVHENVDEQFLCELDLESRESAGEAFCDNLELQSEQQSAGDVDKVSETRETGQMETGMNILVGDADNTILPKSIISQELQTLFERKMETVNESESLEFSYGLSEFNLYSQDIISSVQNNYDTSEDKMDLTCRYQEKEKEEETYGSKQKDEDNQINDYLVNSNLTSKFHYVGENQNKEKHESRHFQTSLDPTVTAPAENYSEEQLSDLFHEIKDPIIPETGLQSVFHTENTEQTNQSFNSRQDVLSDSPTVIDEASLDLSLGNFETLTLPNQMEVLPEDLYEEDLQLENNDVHNRIMDTTCNKSKNRCQKRSEDTEEMQLEKSTMEIDAKSRLTEMHINKKKETEEKKVEDENDAMDNCKSTVVARDQINANFQTETLTMVPEMKSEQTNLHDEPHMKNSECISSQGLTFVGASLEEVVQVQSDDHQASHDPEQAESDKTTKAPDFILDVLVPEQTAKTPTPVKRRKIGSTRKNPKAMQANQTDDPDDLPERSAGDGETETRAEEGLDDLDLVSLDALNKADLGLEKLLGGTKEADVSDKYKLEPLENNFQICDEYKHDQKITCPENSDVFKKMNKEAETLTGDKYTESSFMKIEIIEEKEIMENKVVEIKETVYNFESTVVARDERNAKFPSETLTMFSEIKIEQTELHETSEVKNSEYITSRGFINSTDSCVEAVGVLENAVLVQSDDHQAPHDPEQAESDKTTNALDLIPDAQDPEITAENKTPTPVKRRKIGSTRKNPKATRAKQTSNPAGLPEHSVDDGETDTRAEDDLDLASLDALNVADLGSEIFPNDIKEGKYAGTKIEHHTLQISDSHQHHDLKILCSEEAGLLKTEERQNIDEEAEKRVEKDTLFRKKEIKEEKETKKKFNEETAGLQAELHDTSEVKNSEYIASQELTNLTDSCIEAVVSLKDAVQVQSEDYQAPHDPEQAESDKTTKALDIIPDARDPDITERNTESDSHEPIMMSIEKSEVFKKEERQTIDEDAETLTEEKDTESLITKIEIIAEKEIEEKNNELVPDIPEQTDENKTATLVKRRKMGSTRKNPKTIQVKHAGNPDDLSERVADDRETETRDEEGLDDLDLVSSKEFNTTYFGSGIYLSDNKESQYDGTKLESPENNLQMCDSHQHQEPKMKCSEKTGVFKTEKRQKLGSSRKNQRERKQDPVEKIQVVQSHLEKANDSASEQIASDLSENTLLSEIDKALRSFEKKTSDDPLNADELLISMVNPQALLSIPVHKFNLVQENQAEHEMDREKCPPSQATESLSEPGLPRRQRKLGSTRKSPRQQLKVAVEHENEESDEIKRSTLGIDVKDEQPKNDSEEVVASTFLNPKDQKKKKYLNLPSALTSGSQTEEALNLVIPEKTSPSTKRKFGSRRTNKGNRDLDVTNKTENKELGGNGKSFSSENPSTSDKLAVGDQTSANCSIAQSEAEETEVEDPKNKQTDPKDKNILSVEDTSSSLVSLNQIIHHNRMATSGTQPVQYNVVLVGNSCVGKTSFVRRFNKGEFSQDYQSTIGVDTCKQTLLVEDRSVTLQIWDTAGQERFHSITTQVFHKAHGLVFMYDVTCSKSFLAIRDWISKAEERSRDDVIMMLLGNKNDHAEREVHAQEGESLAREYKLVFMECSAATGANVLDSMKSLAQLLVQSKTKDAEHTTLIQEPTRKKSGCC